MIKIKVDKYLQCVCNELCFCELMVLCVECVGVVFQCIVLGGEVLEGFVFYGFDDYIKFFFFELGVVFILLQVIEEGIDWGEGVWFVICDYMLLYDVECYELVYDFYIYDGGIVSCWVLEVKVGDKLVIGGLCGLLVVLEDYVWQLYVCDEFGMLVLCCCLLGLCQLLVRLQVMVIVIIVDVLYKDYLVDFDGFNIEWVVGYNLVFVVECLVQVKVLVEDYFIWLIGEGVVVKLLLVCFEDESIDQQLVCFQVYWYSK